MLGILSRKMSDSLAQPFRKQTRLFSEIISYGQKQEMEVFVFSPEDIHNDYVLGYTLTENKWTPKTFPIPAFVYDRAFLNKKSSTLIQKQLRKRSTFLNPAGLHELSRDKLMVSRLLQTGAVEYDGMHLIDADHFYLKPRYGSRPTRAIKVIKESMYTVVYKVQDEERKWIDCIVEDIPDDELLEVIQEVTPDYGYIMHEHIESVQVDGFQTMLRVLVQRGAHGIPHITSITGITTDSFHRETIGCEQIFSQFIDPTPVMSQVADTAQQTLKKLEHRFKSRIAEIGFDMIVQPDGKSRIVDMHSMPARFGSHMMTSPQRSYLALKTSIQAPVDYALYLSKSI
ncbi:hypothetical protein H6504_03930 [Candidatus Woesearchaeota archaeon]|nr:hypothetical protein [Candidatus Woesearchaeota archaeon]